MVGDLYRSMAYKARRPSTIEMRKLPKIAISKAVINTLIATLCNDIKVGKESVVYMIGKSDELQITTVKVYKPEAITTPGSFHVPPLSMAKCIRSAADNDMKIVGQLHTHPSYAYHSVGDIEGTKIHYSGYYSIVLPEYGKCLPSLEASSLFIYSKSKEWLELMPEQSIAIKGEECE